MAVQNLTEDTFDEAVNAAPLAMVDIWATWCGPCKMMGPVVDKLAEEYDGKVLVGKVNADDEMDLVLRFGVASIPTLIFFKNGQEIERKVGVTPESEIKKLLDANLGE
ncbi:MAG: thioredoxin [Eubacterium sp.]|nr:thioredoxin [Eubacterium sp.]